MRTVGQHIGTRMPPSEATEKRTHPSPSDSVSTDKRQRRALSAPEAPLAAAPPSAVKLGLRLHGRVTVMWRHRDESGIHPYSGSVSAFVRKGEEWYACVQYDDKSRHTHPLHALKPELAATTPVAATPVATTPVAATPVVATPVAGAAGHMEVARVLTASTLLLEDEQVIAAMENDCNALLGKRQTPHERPHERPVVTFMRLVAGPKRVFERLREAGDTPRMVEVGMVWRPASGPPQTRSSRPPRPSSPPTPPPPDCNSAY